MSLYGMEKVEHFVLLVANQKKQCNVNVMNSEIFAAKVKADPHNALFRFSLGQALMNEGNYGSAVEHLEFCCKSREDWMLARILLGKALVATGARDRAKLILENALQLAIDQHHEDPEAEVRTILADL